MKAMRILQIALLVVVAVYLVLLHNLNPNLAVDLPLLLPIPVALLLAVALLLGWLVGWLPNRLRLWRQGREVARLERRVHELEEHLPSYDRGGTPVIPDRDTSAGGGAGPRGLAARLLRRGRASPKRDEIEPQS